MIELLKKCGYQHHELFQFVKSMDGGLNMCFLIKTYKNVTFSVLNRLNGYKVEEDIEVLLFTICLN